MLKNIVSPRQDLTFSQLKIYYEGKGFNLNDKFSYIHLKGNIIMLLIY